MAVKFQGGRAVPARTGSDSSLQGLAVRQNVLEAWNLLDQAASKLRKAGELSQSPSLKRDVAGVMRSLETNMSILRQQIKSLEQGR